MREGLRQGGINEAQLSKKLQARRDGVVAQLLGVLHKALAAPFATLFPAPEGPVGPRAARGHVCMAELTPR